MMPEQDYRAVADGEILRRYRAGSTLQDLTKLVQRQEVIKAQDARKRVERVVFDALRRG